MVGALLCIVWAVAVADVSRLDWLFVVLALSAIFANLFDAYTDAERVSLSGAALAGILAIAFFGPAAAFAIIAIAEVISWLVERYRLESVPVNLLGGGGPMLIAGTVFEALEPGDDASVGFFLALALAAMLVLVLNLLFLACLRTVDGVTFRSVVVGASRALLVSLAINVPLALAAAGLIVELGTAGSVFAVISLVAFGYMANLVATARHRSRQYASLSWGVLSGLLRTLDIRDPRAARHAAAVAAFSRDIARASGMGPQECELVHTAGLLHDIGHFALSDRVAERGRVLNDEDWTAIRRHPELGADMLRDLGLYGPVAEIVHAHHERIDGRGYPDRLRADRIPEAAKIIAVSRSTTRSPRTTPTARRSARSRR